MVTRRRFAAVFAAASIGIVACTSSSGDVTTGTSTAGRTAETTPDSAATGSPGTTATTGSTVPTTAGGTPPATTATAGTAGTTSTAGAPPESVPTTATEPPDASGLPPLTEPDPLTTTGILANGLRYFIRANDNPGAKAEMRLLIDAGSGIETDQQVGGAHFLEHMLFNGTEQFPKNELIDVLRSFGAAFGADINAYTSYDETVYQLTVPATDPSIVDTGLDVLQQWLSFATIAPDDVVAERGIVLDEWRVRNQTSSGRLFDRIAEFFLAGTAYDGHAPIGNDDAISSTGADALRAYYDDWYRPDNAAVIVVGDIDVARVEQALIERFEPAAPRGNSPAREVLTVTPDSETAVEVASDGALAEGYAFVTLPVSAELDDSVEAELQQELYREMAFEIVATRLNNDALRGEAPFDSARVDESGFVRQLVAPEIYVTADGDDIEGSVRAIIDEYERVRRFGFTEAELQRAANDVLSTAQVTFDGRESRQDASFADEYVDHVLEDEPYVTARREFDFVTEAVGRATVENLAHVFVEQYESAGAHVFAAVPADEVDQAPSAEELIAIVDTADERELEPLQAAAAIGDELIPRPEPIEETSTVALADQPFPDFIAPTVLTFPNGVKVALNTNQIVEGNVFFEARSPGGLAVVADADVPDADALGEVVGNSGVGDFDRVAIDAFLDDKEVDVTAFVDQFEEGLFGRGATSDLEVLFQMIYLTMTQPRVDPVALDQYLDDRLPFAENPGVDAGYAEFVALRDARYDDIRFLAPTVDTLATVDAEGIARVMADRFGDAGDWTFSFSGDFSGLEAIELARSYLATLPATDRTEDPGFAEPPPPPDVVVAETRAGEGQTANVSFQFTEDATTARRDDVLARVVEEVVGNRMTDFIREELGDSYSPFGRLTIGGGPAPATEFYISVSTGPDLVDEVSQEVLAQLEDLRANGPTDREFTNAVATVSEELNFFNNGQINDEALDALVDPEGTPDFDEFLAESQLITTINSGDVQNALREWIPADRYIEVRVLPRT